MLLMSNRNKSFLKKVIVSLFVFCTVFGFSLTSAWAGNIKGPKPEVIDAVIVGDRVVDIAYNLGVLPVAMSARAALWPMAREIKSTSQILGCPNCVTAKVKDAVPRALKKFGVNWVIVEKSSPFCLYKKNVKPENVIPLLKGMDVKIDIVDFTKGLDSAIRQVGVLLGREKEAKKLIDRRAKQMEKLEKVLPESSLNKRTVILNCILQESTGKAFIRVEMPGGYSDKFMLEPLGCKNVGSELAKGKKAEKGYVLIRSISGLVKINPDILIITGSSAPLQKMIQREIKKTEGFTDIPAIREHAIFCLPRYVDSSVIEYPQILRLWSSVFSEK